MLFRPRLYFRPTTIGEATSLLAKHETRARPIAGGTDLLVEKPPELECLVDITRLPLDYIRDHEKGITIGALSTFHKLETSELIREKYDILAETAYKIGTLTIRNMATVGGNVCNGIPSADFPPALIALDAKVRIAGSASERIVPLEEFYVDVRKTALKSGELLVEVQIPRQSVGTGTAFLKLGRTSKDIALVNVAVRVVLGAREVCEDANIVLGAVAPTPIRAKRAEDLLKGKKVEDTLIERASQAASEETKPISDVRASAEYRRQMSKVLVKHALEQAFKRAKIRRLV